MPKEDYKPNSHKYNEQHHYSEPKSESHKVHTTEHKSVGDRLKECFFGESAHMSFEYVVWELVIPKLVNVVTDGLHAFIDSMFRSNSRRGYYSDFYNTSRTRYNSSPRRSEERDHSHYERLHKPVSTENHWFETYEDAQWVLNQLNERCRKYDGVCSVGTFFDLIDYDRPDDWVTSNLGWSWDALDKARIYRKRNGSYVLSIPEPDVRY